MRPWDIFCFLAGSVLVVMVGCTQPARSTETPECVPMIMSTGEAFYPMQLQTPLPEAVIAGQIVQVQLSGGIMLMPQGVDCGGMATIMPPNRATAQATSRRIQVALEDTVLYDQSCPYDCAIEFVVPEDIAPGSYHWHIEIPWTSLDYPVQVLPPSNEASDDG